MNRHRPAVPSGAAGGGAGTRELLQHMVLEEWRLHTELFGARFALFPVLVLAIALATSLLLLNVGADAAGVLLGLHVLVLLFGLHTGAIAFVGPEAFRNLLGDVTLLVFSARTLPLSPRRLVAWFLAKDLLYYGALFILPLALAAAPLVPAAGRPLTHLALLAITLAGTFMLGVVLTVSLVGLAQRTRLLAITLAVGVATLAVLEPNIALQATPLAAFLEPAALRPWVTGSLPIPLLGGLGVLLLDPTATPPVRTAPDRFRPLLRFLPGRQRGLVAKNLLDVARSQGGFGKVVFSHGIILLLVLALLEAVATLTGLAPTPGLVAGALLSLGAFTTYNWLTQFDDISDYLAYPLDVADVMEAKRTAFLLLTLPAGLLLLLGVALVHGPHGLLAGALVLPPLALYLYGVTVYLAGFEPSEFLFDPVLFLGFGFAVALVLVPLVVLAFLYPTDPLRWGALSIAIALAAGLAGWGLGRAAIPRWTQHVHGHPSPPTDPLRLQQG